jgi:2-polyprenyl-3-methyl-5-hydroxy-6-metoxy-1,4-benzoquinol methylase
VDLEQYKEALITDLMEYDNIDREEVMERLATALEGLNDEWCDHFYSHVTTNKTVEEFYDNSDWVKYETAAYNRNVTTLSRQMYLKDNVKGRVLDFGGGVGTDIFLLHIQGLRDLTYIDKGKTKEFALWRFKKHGMDIQSELGGKYDTILMIEVLEHFPDWKPYIDTILGYAHTTTKLLIHAPFNYNPADDPHYFHVYQRDTDVKEYIKNKRPELELIIK